MSSWRSRGWRCNPGPDSAESGRDSVGGPFDRPRKLCGPLFRKQLLSFNKRNSKKGEAPVRARPSLRELHAARCPGGFSQNETNGCPAPDFEGVPRPVAVHPLLRETRWIPVTKGVGFGAMDDGSHRGLLVGGGHQRSSGVGFIGNGHDRPSLPRRREVGSSLPFGVIGGPTTGAVCSQRQVYQSKVGSFLADMPTTVGDDNTVVHKRDGPHQRPQIGSSWPAFEKTTQGRRGYGQASTQEEASEVPKETKARPGPEVEDDGHGCMFSGDLCSGVRPCQAPADPVLPSDAKSPGASESSAKSYWNSLQTFSFARWCSRLLDDVLSSGTPFAAFVKSTLHISRSASLAPDKALFPLPFPKLGLFASRSSRQSSRARRKLAFDQAFHILVAALNFLYADCSFPPLDLLRRVPSSAQWQALWNLRSIMKAFGSSGEEFQVRKSGRRSTNFLAGLCDLSEFITRSGASADSYFHGFAGDSPSLLCGNTLEPDTSRADELIPYRSLDASRIRLSGEANWDPRPYLSDAFLMPYLEPNVLVGHSSFEEGNTPDLDREDPQEILSLAKLWDSKNLLTLRVDLVPDELKRSCLRCFNCWKDESQDRLIGDRRGRNQLELSIPGPSRYLPSGSALAVLEVPAGSSVAICATDLKDYYHQLRVSQSRARSNAMWPPVPLSFLQSTKAYGPEKKEVITFLPLLRGCPCRSLHLVC